MKLAYVLNPGAHFSSLFRFPLWHFFPPEYDTLPCIKNLTRIFPGGPVVKISPLDAGGVGLIPGRRAKIPHALQPKTQNMK